MIFSHADSMTHQCHHSAVFMCLFVCFFSYDISKSDAASITKLDTDMVNHES